MTRDARMDRAIAHWRGDKLVVRASAVGGCVGAIARAAAGITGTGPPAKMLEVFGRGHVNEPRAVELLRSRGWWIEGDGDDQEMVVFARGGIIVEAHPDGFVCPTRGADRSHVVEIKTLKTGRALDVERYKWQVSVQMLATGLKGLVVTSRVGEDELDIVELDDPPYDAVAVVRRLADVWRGVDEGFECDQVQWPCGYWTDATAACGATRMEAVVDPPCLHVSAETLRRFKVARGVERDAKADVSAIRDELKKVLEDRAGADDREFVLGEGKDALTATRKTRRSLDRQKLEKEIGTLEKFETTTEYWDVR